ncbi:MAG: MarR family transcriptional regulator [Bacteroidota bacterium]|nr:MarR family transcriptional regulator [Bacteroidota bacterium]MDP4230690.1 MarR family transcriptional regulator [Bacteroidota bacterium]MDP4235081.1 MarR family transcriptional regulator [Bacteroidota bacterium]
MKKTIRAKGTADSTQILNDIRRLVQAIRMASLDSEKKIGLSVAQLLILQRLREEDDLSVNDLAERTMTHQSSVSVIVKKLEQKRLVKRSTSDEDARKYKISLTKKGAALMKKAPPPVHDTLIDALEKLDPKTRGKFAEGFSAFLKMASINGTSPIVFVFLPKILKRFITIIAGIT